jgi:hypothetical protein
MNYMNLKKRGFSYVLDTTYKDYFIKIWLYKLIN